MQSKMGSGRGDWGSRALRNAWSMMEVRRLRQLADLGISPSEVAKALGRTESAIRNKALFHGISFRRATSAELASSELASSES